MLESRSICQSGQPRWAKISRPHSKATCPATILAIADDANALSYPQSRVAVLTGFSPLARWRHRNGLASDGLDRRARSMILHVDMDAFYASVEIRDNPSLASLPVVVGGSAEGRGVVSTANYIARSFGIHSAMSAATAKRLCPHAVFLRPRMEHYAAISKKIRQIFMSYTDRVEPLSLDEAFLDVTGSQLLFGDAVSIAKEIKQRIRSEVGLTASAGVAPNKYVAKVASDLKKPDGLVVVLPDEVQSFLDPLPVTRIWGIGSQTEKKMERLGIRTIAQLRAMSLEFLKSHFGIHSEFFYRLARGIDARAVVPDRDAKSISHETTFPKDVVDPEILHAWIVDLADQVARRLRRHRIYCRTIQLKMRYSNFETMTRSRTLAEPTQGTDVLSKMASLLFDENSTQIDRGIRLLGVGVSHLQHDQPIQQLLFDQEETHKAQRIDQATDHIRDKFGSKAVARGSAFRPKSNED